MTTTNKKSKQGILQTFLSFFKIDDPKLNEEGRLILNADQKSQIDSTYGEKAPTVIEKLEALLSSETPPSVEDLTDAVTQMKALQTQVDDLTAENNILANLPEPIGNPNTGANIHRVDTGGVPKILFDPRFFTGNAAEPWSEKTPERTWYARIEHAFAGKGRIEPTYSDIDISNLGRDMSHFWELHGGEFIDYNFDTRDLPDFWIRSTASGADGVWPNIELDEVSQARKQSWLPKGSFKFADEGYHMYNMQIDVEILGYQLQALEKTFIAMYYKVGANSQAYKPDFIRFLVQKLINVDKTKNAQRTLVGAFYQTPATATTAGKSINAIRGLIPLLYLHMANRKVLPFNMGTPVVGTTHRYLKQFMLNIPEESRDMVDVVYVSKNLHIQVMQDYLDEFKNTPNPQYMAGARTYNTVLDFPNVAIVPLNFMGTSNLVFATTKENVILLDQINGEQSQLTLETTKRVYNIIGDYTKSVFFPRVGLKKDVGSQDYSRQIIFMNNVVEPFTYVPQPADVTVLDTTLQKDSNNTPLDWSYHHSMQVGVNTAAQTITNILNAKAGAMYFVKGNTGVAATIPNSGVFSLKGGAFSCDPNAVLQLYYNGTIFLEVKRWVESTSTVGNTVALAPNATTINALSGLNFSTSTNTGATALTTITGASVGVVYRITGAGGTANATTIAKNSTFNIISNITLVTGAYIDLMFTGSDFMEVGRG